MNRTIWIVLLVLNSVVIGIVLGWYMHQGYLARKELSNWYELRDACQRAASQAQFPEGERLRSQDAKWFLIDNRKTIVKISTEIFGYNAYSTGGSSPDLQYHSFPDFICLYNGRTNLITGIRVIYPVEGGHKYFSTGAPYKNSKTFFIPGEG